MEDDLINFNEITNAALFRYKALFLNDEDINYSDIDELKKRINKHFNEQLNVDNDEIIKEFCSISKNIDEEAKKR